MTRLLCDLESGKVVDLLPDRSAESTAQWLRTHPGAEIVSRDRASLYAQGATTAAPQAVQVADRWHLLHNLSEAFIGALMPHHRLLVEAAHASASKTGAPVTLPVLQVVVAKPSSRYHKKQEHNRERRLATYQAVMEQISRGVTQHEAAQSCGLGNRQRDLKRSSGRGRLNSCSLRARGPNVCRAFVPCVRNAKPSQVSYPQ